MFLIGPALTYNISNAGNVTINHIYEGACLQVNEQTLRRHSSLI